MDSSSSASTSLTNKGPTIEIPKISLVQQQEGLKRVVHSSSSVEAAQAHSPHSHIFSFDSSDSSYNSSPTPTPPTIGSPPSPVGSIASFGSPTFPEFVSASSRIQKDRATSVYNNDPYFSTSAPHLLLASTSAALRHLTSSRSPISEMDSSRTSYSSAPASSSSSSSTFLNQQQKIFTKRINQTMAEGEVIRDLSSSGDDLTKPSNNPRTPSPSPSHSHSHSHSHSASQQHQQLQQRNSDSDEVSTSIPDDALQQVLDRQDDPFTIQAVEQLLAQNANVNAVDVKGRTPLHIAVINSNLEAALLLVDHGADIMCQSTLVPRSPLNLALLNANLSGLDTDKTMQEKMKRLAFLMQGKHSSFFVPRFVLFSFLLLLFSSRSYLSSLSSSLPERYVIAQIKKNVETKSDVLLIENCSISNFGNGIHTLTWLKTLYLGHNSLEVIPASIQNLKLLEVLDLPTNKIKELPAAINELRSLRKLNLKNNKLDNLPTHLAFLTSLKELIVEGNPLKKLPVEMRKAQTPKLLSFLGELSHGSILCNRIRLIFVGQEGVSPPSFFYLLSFLSFPSFAISCSYSLCFVWFSLWN
jgi:Leucine-rich repeat (LRR) protein